MDAEITLPIRVSWEKSGNDLTIKNIFAGHNGGPSITAQFDKDELKELKDYVLDMVKHDKETSGEELLDWENIKVEVDYKIIGSKDEESVDIKSINFGSVNVESFVSDKDLSDIEDSVWFQTESYEPKRYRNAIEKVEKRLYSRMQRGKLKSKLGKKGKSKIPGFGYWFKRN